MVKKPTICHCNKCYVQRLPKERLVTRKYGPQNVMISKYTLLVGELSCMLNRAR